MLYQWRLTGSLKIRLQRFIFDFLISSSYMTPRLVPTWARSMLLVANFAAVFMSPWYVHFLYSFHGCKVATPGVQSTGITIRQGVVFDPKPNSSRFTSHAVVCSLMFMRLFKIYSALKHYTFFRYSLYNASISPTCIGFYLLQDMQFMFSYHCVVFYFPCVCNSDGCNLVRRFISLRLCCAISFLCRGVYIRLAYSDLIQTVIALRRQRSKEELKQTGVMRMMRPMRVIEQDSLHPFDRR